MVSFEIKLTKPRDVLIQQVPEGDSVLLHVKSGQYFGLDKIGHVMWTKLVSASSIQAAYDEILAEYDVDSQRLREDLTKLIEELISNDLLEVVET